ncbi:hypothetical protein EKO04_006428 [Ascochyta lentis]|uniref:Uncharacterized protein n=1 Tax=Ascochyta lentis TaxID=205686 RepID=A0A8H7MJ63_9PLEO|nr:hypothetical protein EKO04_006428 [Ascochyta lentis]
MATSEADLSPSGPSGSNKLSVPTSVRRDSSSSYSSDAYSPLPPGRWNLNLHGNCPKCHHHHSFARFKVNIPSNPNITTHVRCQACDAKWLAIGGRNATQLSLLSINSLTPDPAVETVRYSLVHMIRTTTALATLSPVLAGIAESPASSTPSRQHSTRIAQVNETRINTSSTKIPGKSVPIQLPGSVGFDSPLSVRPITNQKYGLWTGRHISHFKESMGIRFPAFHRANLRTRFGITKPPKMSVRRWGKQPISTPMVAEHVTDSDHAPDLSLSGEASQGCQAGGPTARDFEPDKTYDSSDTAIQFLQNLASETTHLALMTEKEKAVWVRAKYTEFKNRIDVAGDVGDPMPQLVQLADLISRQGRGSDELLGLGSHLAAFDEYRPRDSFSISERTSEAETAVDDTTAISLPRYSLVDFLQRERRGSGSPRPHSMTASTLQPLRRGRREVRFSMDSAVTGEVRRSSSIPRSTATDRYSQSSAVRTSMLSSTRLNMSQASLASY